MQFPNSPYEKPILEGLSERQIFWILTKDLAVGDLVSFAKGDQQNNGIYLGRITKLEEHRAAILTIATNRTTYRSILDVHKLDIDLADFKSNNPELFI